MKLKKYALLFGTIVALGCSLLACGKGGEDTETPTSAPTEAPTKAAEPTKAPKPVHKPTATEIVADMVIGWNLGNSLDSFVTGQTGLTTETSWGNPYSTKAMIDGIKEAGFNAVRVPVTWYNHMDASTNQIDKEWMDRVEEVVNYVLDNDMYCIINVHHDTGEKGWLKASENGIDTKKAKFKAIWEQVSERFGDYGDKLLFEGFNELLDEESNWTKPGEEAGRITNELNQLFVDTVRASGNKNATRCLIVNTYCAGANKDVLKYFVLPEDTVADKLIVETHIYQPYYFTSEVSPDVTDWANGKPTLESYIYNMYENFIKKGTPVIIGEFGAVDKDNLKPRMSWLRFFVDTCYKYGIKCFWWDNGNAAEYEIFDRTTLEITEPDLLEVMMTEATGGSYVFPKVEEVPEEPKEKDPNLCANKNSWSNYINSGNGAAGNVKITDNGVRVSVEQPGGNAWDVQFSYVGLTFEQGVTYKVSFNYTGTPAQTMNFHMMQNYDPYVTYATVALEYKEETQTYEGTFTMTEPTDKNSRITFDCGASDCGMPYSVEIENLVLMKVEENAQ